MCRNGCGFCKGPREFISSSCEVCAHRWGCSARDARFPSRSRTAVEEYPEGVQQQSPGLAAQAAIPGLRTRIVTNPERVAHSLDRTPTKVEPFQGSRAFFVPVPGLPD